MRLDDLDLRELLDYRPEGGLIHFAGRRVVLLDVVALDLATGADLNRSADRLALRTYRHVYEYRFAAFPEGLEALSDADLVPGVVPDLDFPRESPQGEAVAYDPFTGHLLTISEHVRGIGIPSLHELPCAE